MLRLPPDIRRITVVPADPEAGTEDIWADVDVSGLTVGHVQFMMQGGRLIRDLYPILTSVVVDWNVPGQIVETGAWEVLPVPTEDDQSVWFKVKGALVALLVTAISTSLLMRDDQGKATSSQPESSADGSSDTTPEKRSRKKKTAIPPTNSTSP